ncbi:MAG TPA: sensor histidine kinase [Gaiellaceae bacterium]
MELALRPFATERRAEIADWALAVGLAVLAVGTTWTGSGERNEAVVTVLALAGLLPFAWRRRHPIPVLVWLFVCVGLIGAIDNSDQLYVFLAAILGLYSVGAHASRRAGAAALAAALVVLLIGFALDDERTTTGDYFFVVVLLGGAWGLGVALRERRTRATLLEDHAARLDREQEQRARQAVLEERARIARELHDVVAHSVSVMNVQTGVVRRRIADASPQEAELLDEVEHTGRQALAEMRRLLGLLRADDEGPSLEPQPGMASLPALVDRMREAGLQVEVSVVGEERVLQPGVDLAAYRIVQEALTNVFTHGGGATARVAVRYEPRRIVVDVEDDGPGETATDGLGHGLVGMRERAALYGGTLEAGPRAGGGFAVHASLPVEEDGA